MVSGPDGDLHPDQPHGLFARDTRVLSRFSVEVDDQPLSLVSTVTRGPFDMSIVTRAHHTLHPDHADPPIAVLRHRVVDRGLRERIEIRNHSIHQVETQAAIVLDADYASLFDVKGEVFDPSRTATVEAEMGRLRLVPHPSAGLDASVATVVELDPPPDAREEHRLTWEFVLGPGERRSIDVAVLITQNGESARPDHSAAGSTLEIRNAATSSWVDARFRSSDRRIERATEQSLLDLAVLRIFDPAHADRVVVAAGAPWFMALFGRDSILTAWMALIADHHLAAGVLRSLADAQGRSEVGPTEEQPGRILHEVRYDQRSLGMLGGSNVYYGTVDATPLFVMLVAEYLRWTNDQLLVDELRPAVDRALAWIDEYGDVDGDGFVEYRQHRPGGLINQGWKDSWDGVRYGDGRVAEPPIALCEVQGYVYGAYRAKAYLDRISGDERSAAAWDRRAEKLRTAFDRAFWLEDEGYYAIGLDGDNQPIDSVASNVGHCLWTGIVPSHRASTVGRRLVSPDLCSGWGLRTLAEANPAFNPLSYHCGSVWPHDTAIAIAGLERYGLHDQARRLREGLLDTAVAQGGRLPELFAGFARSELPAPVAYPASCAPQAWAAAAPLLVVRSMIGLDPDLPNRTIRVGRRLQQENGQLRVDGVPLGGGRVSIEADEQTIALTNVDPAVNVTAA